MVTDFEKSKSGQNLELGENIEVIEVSEEELKQICLSGKMQEDRSAGITLRYLSSL